MRVTNDRNTPARLWTRRISIVFGAVLALLGVGAPGLGIVGFSVPGLANPSWAGMPDERAERAVTLTVIARGAVPAKGQVVASLFTNPRDFLRQPAMRLAAPVTATGDAVVVFEGLMPGDYALSVIHDEDSNGRLNRNFLGIPTERFGFSNNIRPRMRRPDWTEAAITVEDPGGEVIIELKTL